MDIRCTDNLVGEIEGLIRHQDFISGRSSVPVAMNSMKQTFIAFDPKRVKWIHSVHFHMKDHPK